MDTAQPAITKPIPSPTKQPASQLHMTFTNSHVQNIPSDPTPNLAEYTVTLHTSDLPGAGTDCTAYIVVHGKDGVCGKQGLSPSGGAFTRGSVQTCAVQGQNVGRMLYITISHNDDGTCLINCACSRKVWPVEQPSNHLCC